MGRTHAISVTPFYWALSPMLRTHPRPKSPSHMFGLLTLISSTLPFCAHMFHTCVPYTRVSLRHTCLFINQLCFC